MPRRAQCHDRLLQSLALDQHVIRIKRRNREDRDLRFRQRLRKLCQHAGHRKRKRPFEFQRYPSALDGWPVRHTIFGADVFRANVFGAGVLRTNNGKLIARAHHAEKPALQRPRRNAGIGGKPAHRQPLYKNTVFQIVRQLRKEGYYISPPAATKCCRHARLSRLLHIPAHRHVAELLPIEEQGRAAAVVARFFNVYRFDIFLFQMHFSNGDRPIRQIHNYKLRLRGR